MAWGLLGCPPGTPGSGSELRSWPRHAWIATRPPPLGGLRRRANKPGQATRASDQRFLAVAAFPIANPGPGFTSEAHAHGGSAAEKASDGGGGADAVFGSSMDGEGGMLGVVAASSDASVALLCLDVASRRYGSPAQAPNGRVGYKGRVGYSPMVGVRTVRSCCAAPCAPSCLVRLQVSAPDVHSSCRVLRRAADVQAADKRGAVAAAVCVNARPLLSGTTTPCNPPAPVMRCRWRTLAALQRQHGATLCLAHLTVRRAPYPSPDRSCHTPVPARHSAKPSPATTGGRPGDSGLASGLAKPCPATAGAPTPTAAHAKPPPNLNAHAVAELVFGGATHGGIAAWDVAAAAAAATAEADAVLRSASGSGCRHDGLVGGVGAGGSRAAADTTSPDMGLGHGSGHGSPCEGMGCGGRGKTDVGSRERVRPAAGGPVDVPQVLALPGVHQSGVNALCVARYGAAAPNPTLIRVTVGYPYPNPTLVKMYRIWD